MIANFTVTLLAVLLMVASGLLSDPVEAQGGTLSLGARTSSLNVLASEPVDLTLSFSNSGSAEIKWNKPIAVGKGVDFVITGADGSTRTIAGSDYAGGMSYTVAAVTKRLRKEESRYLLDRKLVENLFPTAGEYQMRIDLTYQDLSGSTIVAKTVHSNIVRVVVGEPRGRDAEARSYVLDNLELLHCAQKANEEWKGREDFVAMYKGTGYWKWEAFKLARRYFDQGRYREAEDLFYELSDTDFYHDTDVGNYLDKLAHMLTRPFGRTKRRFPATKPLEYRETFPANAGPVYVTPITRPVIIQPSPTPQ